MTLIDLYGVRIMHTYEKAPGSNRQSGYTGLFAVICLFASIFLVWALMRTSLVKSILEMVQLTATCNNWNSYELTSQGEALSSSRGQHAQQIAGSPSCLGCIRC